MSLFDEVERIMQEHSNFPDPNDLARRPGAKRLVVTCGGRDIPVSSVEGWRELGRVCDDIAENWRVITRREP